MQRYTVYLYLETALHVSGGAFHPSSGAHTTVSTASGICHTVTAICRYRGRAGIHLQYFHDSSKGMTSTRCCRYICLRSLCWMKLTL